MNCQQPQAVGRKRPVINSGSLCFQGETRVQSVGIPQLQPIVFVLRHQRIPVGSQSKGATGQVERLFGLLCFRIPADQVSLPVDGQNPARISDCAVYGSINRVNKQWWQRNGVGPIDNAR